VKIGFQRSSVVMMNEAHAGEKRCIRTRQIGKRILPVAHQVGTRYLAMEALFLAFAEQCNKTRRVAQADQGYLSQPEMREFIQTALDLGWTLIAYEANSFEWLSAKYGAAFQKPRNAQEYSKYQTDLLSMEYTNWREEQQALNLIGTLKSLPVGIPLLVWCGNSHHSKQASPDWLPMGYQFKKISGIDHFVIDQLRTVNFDGSGHGNEFVAQFANELTSYGGTAGFLAEEAPSIFSGERIADAYLLSTQNDLE